MPRDGNGVYSKPAGIDATPDTTIESADWNAFTADVEQDLNTPRPIKSGGTGANTVIAAADALSTQGANIASAATTNLALATGVNVTITGTTTITSFGIVAAGVRRHLTFAGALTLTHNAASLILPGGANIATAVGDTAEVVSLGSGNWRVVRYTKANGTVLDVAMSDIQTALNVAPWIPKDPAYNGTGTDMNTLVTPGFSARVELPLSANGPPVPGTFYLLVFSAASGGRISQLLVPYSTSSQGIWFRTYTGTWSTWDKLASISEVLKLAGGTMTGDLTLSGNASSALHAVPKQQLDAGLATKAPTPYTGSTQDETVFPIGHHIIMQTNVNRNQTAIPRLDAADASSYTASGTAALLAGTWRARGRTVVGGVIAHLSQRVA